MSASSVTRLPALLSMTSPLGPDKLIPTELRAEEAISAPFVLRIEMVAEEAHIDPDRLLNAPVRVTLRRSHGVTRHFHGIVREFQATGRTVRDLWTYAAEAVPKLWFLAQTEDCRVFEGKTTREIVETLLSDGGVPSGTVEFRLYGETKTREYTVQYNETDLAFATRLMEQEGWFYFFEHSDSAHKLVIADSNTAFKLLGDVEFTVDPAMPDSRDRLTLWRAGLATAHGKVKLTDYDPDSPGAALEARQNTRLRTGGADARDLYHWPALTNDTGQVSDRARHRIEGAEVAASLIESAGCQEGLYAGARFRLRRDSFGAQAGGEYVVRSITHQVTDDTWSANTGRPPSYGNRFIAFPAERPWRPPLLAPRPRMGGLYSAVVIGGAGEEINTDKLGRIKVRFRWDHLPSTTPGGAIWVRVIQPWAGNGWGWQFLPRVGTEVAVAFMDGDPDRPVVVGGLYNGDQLPPFALTGQKTVSGLRTRSSQGGGKEEYSELSFDDAAGKEVVLLHAQKDLKTEVEHDQTLTVDNCRVKKVKQDETVEIGNKQSVKIGQGRSVAISSGGDALKIDNGDRAVTLALGNIAWKAQLGAITGEAMQSIELKVGTNSLKIDQTGVTISAIMIKLSGEAMVEVGGPLTSVKADGMLMLKGGLVMLN